MHEQESCCQFLRDTMINNNYDGVVFMQVTWYTCAVAVLWSPLMILKQPCSGPSSLRGSTLGIRAAEHKGCNRSMQIDWWWQPRAVFGHRFHFISWHMPQKWSQFNCMTLSWWSRYDIVPVTLHYHTRPQDYDSLSAEIRWNNYINFFNEFRKKNETD